MKEGLAAFADNTKKDCLLISAGLGLLVISYALRSSIGKIAYLLVAAAGIITLIYSGVHFGNELHKATPDLFYNDSTKKNVIVGYGLCLALAFTVSYATYKLAF